MTVIGSLRSLIPYSTQSPKAWGSEFVRAQVEKTLSDDPIADAINARRLGRPRIWERPSVSAAVGVPAIHRAVSLIAATTGMLSVQAYRNGEAMDDPPRIVVRPDPDLTPFAFYSSSAANMAKYGEIVWWIATRDNDGLASALVNVPLRELRVEPNTRDRRRPKYKWGTTEGTRYSPANPEGAFVHILYPLAEPFAERGEGPLQLCGAANSVVVESQEWAANFYGRGGWPREIVKYAGELDPTPKDDMGVLDLDAGVSEADRFKIQYTSRANNEPIIIDSRVESIEARSPDVGGAQMLDARQFNNGDAAREFGIPGPLLEYQQPGSSLTYQNRTDLKGHFLEMCLIPLYLEPMEQALSDLLTRSTVARFNTKGFLRADVKTRFEVHEIAVKNGIYDQAYAQKEEGIISGDVEYRPVPAAQPAAIPTPIPSSFGPASIAMSLSRDVRCPSCNKYVAKALGPGSEIECRGCKTLVRGGDLIDMVPEPTRNELHVHLPENMVSVPVNITQPDIRIEPAAVNVTSPPTTLNVTMPDTEARIAELGAGLDALTSGLDGLLAAQSVAHEETQARLTEVADAHRDVAAQLAVSLKPRKIVPIREAGQIVSMTSEVA